MIARTHVCYGRQEFVVAVCDCAACVCFLLRVRQYVNLGQKQAVICFRGSFDGDCADMCFEKRVRCHGLFRSLGVLHTRGRGVCVCARTHMCVANAKGSWSYLGLR